MSDQFVMRWPSLGKQVVFEKIGHNQEQFDWWVSQLPLKSVQGHVLVAGWGMTAWSVPLKKPTTWEPRTEVTEVIRFQKDGRLNMFMPMGGVTTILAKYGEFTETLGLASFGQVREEDIDTLREVGEAVWRAVIKTKEIIIVEYISMEAV